jgi:hypothetical protein
MKKTKKTPLDHLDDIDVFFDPTPLTEVEKKLLSAAIAAYKKKGRKKNFAKRKQAA